jgi:hypothetical protein
MTKKDMVEFLKKGSMPYKSMDYAFLDGVTLHNEPELTMDCHLPVHMAPKRDEVMEFNKIVLVNDTLMTTTPQQDIVNNAAKLVATHLRGIFSL